MTPSRRCCLHRADERRPVLERVGEAHDRARSGRAALSSRSCRSVYGSSNERLAVELEHVEDVVDEVRAALLHGREARAAVLVDRAHLAVEHRVRRADRAGQRPRHGREALGQVVVAPAHELHLAAAQVGERAVAVPLHLEEPALLRRDVLGERREHRRVLLGHGRLAGLADEEPVLLLAAELRRDERPEPLEPLAVERARSARRRASPRPARRCPSPRSRPCRLRRSPSGSRPRRSRTRAGGPRRGRRGGAGRSRAGRPSAPPSSRARRRAPGGSRSGARRACVALDDENRPLPLALLPPNGSGVFARSRLRS